MKYFINHIVSLIFSFFADFGATMRLDANNLAGNITGVAVASAATITINSAITPVSGTTQTTLVKVPTGYRGLLVFVPSGAWPVATGGTYAASDGTYESIPFAASVTCAANKPLICVCDGLKLYPTLSA